MTDKRLFGVVKGHREHITDHTGRLYSDSEVADWLNTVHEENEQLKSENKKLNERIGILEGSLIDKGFDIND